MTRVLLLAILLLGPLSSLGQSEELTDIPLGRKVSNIVTVGKTQIPLPAGEWEILASGTARPDNSGKLGFSFLIQEGNKSGFDAIAITANIENAGCNGWQRNKAICDRKNTHHNESDKNYNQNSVECWDVKHYIIDPDREAKSDYQKKIFQYTRTSRGGRTTYMMNSFFRANRCRFVRLQYLVSPENFKFPSESSPWETSAWHPNAVGNDPERKKFVNAVKEVGGKLSAAVEGGLSRELDDWTSNITLKFD